MLGNHELIKAQGVKRFGFVTRSMAIVPHRHSATPMLLVPEENVEKIAILLNQAYRPKLQFLLYFKDSLTINFRECYTVCSQYVSRYSFNRNA